MNKKQNLTEIPKEPRKGDGHIDLPKKGEIEIKRSSRGNVLVDQSDTKDEDKKPNLKWNSTKIGQKKIMIS